MESHNLEFSNLYMCFFLRSQALSGSEADKMLLYVLYDTQHIVAEVTDSY